MEEKYQGVWNEGILVIFSRCYAVMILYSYLQTESGRETFLNLHLFFYFYLCIYPPDSQESDEGTMHRTSNYPTCFRKCQDIAIRLKF